MTTTNLYLVTGRTGKVELGSRNGSPVCYVDVATNRWWYDEQGERQEATDWHSITFWGKLAEAVARNVGVGDLVTVQGTLRPWSAERNGTRRYGVELRGERFERLVRKRNGDAGEDESAGEADEPTSEGGHVVEPDGMEDDDIPF